MSDSVAVVDCDTHFWQPLDEWEPYIDPAHREVVVEYVAASDPMPKLDAAVREKLLADMAQIRGGDHAPDRLRWMDDEGIAVNVIYPGWLHASAPDPVVASAAARAMNRWAADFASAAPERLLPCMTLPMGFPDRALAELRYAVDELGLRVVFAAPTPDRARRWSDPSLDPLWAAMQDAGVVMTFHEFTRLGGDAPFVARESYRDSYALMYLCGHSVEAQLAVMDVIGGGVLERFPRLKVGFVEAHVAWLPGWLALMDSLWPRISTSFRERTGTGTLALRPTEYFGRQCFITAFPDDAWIAQVVEHVGEDCVTLATDFPHPQTRYGVVKMFEDQQAELPQGVRDKILGGNAARIFGL